MIGCLPDQVNQGNQRKIREFGFLEKCQGKIREVYENFWVVREKSGE